MILNSLFPVFGVLLIGWLLNRFDLTGRRFLEISDRLIYFIFFPALLFWKIGATTPPTIETWRLCKAALCAVALIYILSALTIKLFHIPRRMAGSFSQSCYRFNTYIGMAVILNAFGEEGVRHFGVLIGLLIPFINVLAVSTLIWFSGKPIPMAKRAMLTAKSLIVNPLIVACLAGIFYARVLGMFPVFIDNTLRLIASVTLPMALLSIGGALSAKKLKGYFRVSFVAAVLKLAILPGIGYVSLKTFGLSGTAFKAGMVFFALPTSTAIYVLSSQLDSDTDLASASIVMSTALSFASLSVVLVLP
jgi:predicted permease